MGILGQFDLKIKCLKFMSENFKKEVGERLLLVRRSLNLTQQELGNILSCSQTKIKNIEKGRLGITPETAIILTQKYKISLDWLYSGIGQMYNPFLVLPDDEKEFLNKFLSKLLK